MIIVSKLNYILDFIENIKPTYNKYIKNNVFNIIYFFGNYFFKY